MSALVPILSALHPGADAPGKATGLPVLTQTSHGGYRLYEGRPGVLPVDANEDDSSPTREYPEGSTWVDPDGTLSCCVALSLLGLVQVPRLRSDSQVQVRNFV